MLEADEPQNVTEGLVDEGVGSPGSELWPNSSWRSQRSRVNSAKVDVVDSVVEGAVEALSLEGLLGK